MIVYRRSALKITKICFDVSALIISWVSSLFKMNTFIQLANLVPLLKNIIENSFSFLEQIFINHQ